MPTHQSYTGELTTLLDEYRTKGRTEAANHRPPSTASHPDQNETALRTQAERWLNDEQRLFDFQLTEARRAVVDLRQKGIELEARATQLKSDRSLLSAVEAEMAQERSALVTVTEARVRAEVDWRSFRQANNITEEASYPDSHYMHFAVVAVFALIETVVNAFFYENAQGLLGGFSVALGVAAVNMGGAMALGMGFRFKNLPAADKKAFGWLCFVLFVGLSLYCNALFAAFRAEYQTLQDPTDIAQVRQAFGAAALEAKRIFALNMQIADLMSFVLFGIGLLLSGLAFWKGYTFDDRYPGHGKKDRAVKTARRIELEKQDLLRQKLKDFLHRRRGEVHAALNEPTQLIGRAASQYASLSGAQASLRAQAEAIQRDYRLVLDAYRQANAAVRGTPPPAYFSQFDDLSQRASTEAAVPVLDDLTKVQSELAALRDRIQPELSDKLRELSEDAAKVLNTTIADFILEVEKEAQAQINRLIPTLARAT